MGHLVVRFSIFGERIVTIPNTVHRGTVQEAADYLSVSAKTIRRYITAGLIRAERIGPKLIRVDMSSLDLVGQTLHYVDGDR